jgi:hypothetical protein
MKNLQRQELYIDNNNNNNSIETNLNSFYYKVEEILW